MPIDLIKPTWINAPDALSEPKYDAETLRRANGGLVSGGDVVGVARSGVLNPRDLVTSLAGTMVKVGPGGCVVGSSKGPYLTAVSGVIDVGELVVADETNPRRDRVIVEICDPDNGSAPAEGRRARIRVLPGTPDPTATSGSGVQPEPPLSTTIAFIDVPKATTGNPVATDARSFAVASGGIILVRNQAERNDLPTWVGLTVSRMDVPGIPLERWDGTTWRRGLRVEIGQGANDPTHASGVAIVTTNANGDGSITLPVPFGSKVAAYTVNDATATSGAGSLGAILLKPTYGLSTRTTLTFRAYSTNGVPLASTPMAVMWMADGY